jgi:hypothetical protein
MKLHLINLTIKNTSFKLSLVALEVRKNRAAREK